MATQIILIVISLCVSCVSLQGQERTLNVWEHGIPGAKASPAYHPDTVYADGNRIRLIKVVRPVLDFYPCRPTQSPRAAIIICPGGGYGRLAIDHEGSAVAAWLNTLSLSAFVLKYRLPSDAIMIDKSIGPLQDVQEAVRIVRRRAREWNIDPRKIGVMGFSAGGHLAATVSTHFDEKVYEATDTVSARPDFSILLYPVISMDTAITHRGSRENLLGENPSRELAEHFSNERCVTNRTPPAFIVHAMDDKTVRVENSIRYALALDGCSIPCELHLYQSGGHGFGLGRGDGTEATWPEACRRWLQARGIGGQ